MDLGLVLAGFGHSGIHLNIQEVEIEIYQTYFISSHTTLWINPGFPGHFCHFRVSFPGFRQKCPKWPYFRQNCQNVPSFLKCLWPKCQKMTLFRTRKGQQNTRVELNRTLFYWFSRSKVVNFGLFCHFSLARGLNFARNVRNVLNLPLLRVHQAGYGYTRPATGTLGRLRVHLAEKTSTWPKRRLLGRKDVYLAEKTSIWLK